MALRQTIELLEHDQGDDIVSPPSSLAAWFPASEPTFSVLERNVILLARRDALASLEPPGVLERTVAWVFGLRAGGRRLADPRLEALRRAVVVTRHRHHLPDAVAADLRDHGYGPTRIAGLETLALAG